MDCRVKPVPLVQEMMTLLPLRTMLIYGRRRARQSQWILEIHPDEVEVGIGEDDGVAVGVDGDGVNHKDVARLVGAAGFVGEEAVVNHIAHAGRLGGEVAGIDQHEGAVGVGFSGNAEGVVAGGEAGEGEIAGSFDHCAVGAANVAGNQVVRSPWDVDEGEA